ncbi:hypothetical protein DL96DRAFT_1787850 [Flagelloscypha sp. PMI_526]|nr:hypothetical protein DL96DRAFT_1787850 [Flagelloscypha sp. PMI_526]
MDNAHQPMRPREPPGPHNGSSRRSRSHSRSQSEQVTPSTDLNASPIPAIPPRSQRQQKPAPVPSVVPPGYPEGTTWVVDSFGRPRLETPEQRRLRYESESAVAMQTGQRHDPFPQSQVHPISSTLHHQSAFQDEPTRYSISKSTNNKNSRRSRSHSRSRLEHVTPALDSNAPPVPIISQRSNRTQKSFPVPSVIPPGFPEHTSQYDLVVLTDATTIPRTLRALCLQREIQSPSSLVQDPSIDAPRPPETVDQEPQKPFFKRIFGGFGGKKGLKTAEPAQVGPAIPQLSSRAERRSRTNSM